MLKWRMFCELPESNISQDYSSHSSDVFDLWTFLSENELDGYKFHLKGGTCFPESRDDVYILVKDPRFCIQIIGSTRQAKVLKVKVCAQSSADGYGRWYTPITYKIPENSSILSSSSYSSFQVIREICTNAIHSPLSKMKNLVGKDKNGNTPREHINELISQLDELLRIGARIASVSVRKRKVVLGVNENGKIEQADIFFTIRKHDDDKRNYKLNPELHTFRTISVAGDGVMGLTDHLVSATSSWESKRFIGSYNEFLFNVHSHAGFNYYLTPLPPLPVPAETKSDEEISEQKHNVIDEEDKRNRYFTVFDGQKLSPNSAFRLKVRQRMSTKQDVLQDAGLTWDITQPLEKLSHIPTDSVLLQSVQERSLLNMNDETSDAD